MESENLAIREDVVDEQAGVHAQARKLTPSVRTHTRYRALHMPDATAFNPYQRCLAEGLADNGVDVECADFRGRWPLLSAMSARQWPRVLHLHWTHQLIVSPNRWRGYAKGLRFLAELAVLRLKGTRLVWTAHNLIEHERTQPRWERLVTGVAIRCFHRVVVHCEQAGEAMRHFYGERRLRRKLAVVPHGHYVGAYPDEIGRDEARRHLGLDDDDRVFLHLGQIRPYKGVFDLLEAFVRVPDAKARLLIAGKAWGQDTADDIRLYAWKDSRVRAHLGFVDDALLPCYLKAADVVVLPYRDVLTSGTAMLAMSYARAVIMPRCGCAEEMLDAHGGILYDPNRPHALRDALRAATTLDLSTMGQCNRQRAESLSWPWIGAETRRAYGVEEGA